MIAKHLKDELPVPYHETFDVLDSSKIQCFMDCPRKFFFRYVLGWQPVAPNIHFVFGGAWHEAMRHLLQNGYNEVEVLKAYMKFQSYWKKKFPHNWLEEEHYAKNLENAEKALKQYAKEWKHFDRNEETLYTEVAGNVPIDKETLLFVKLDSIIRTEDGSIISREHKTTGRKTTAWLEKWPSKIQVGTYTHFLNVLFPDDANGLEINGAIVRKKSNEFLRIPVRLQQDQMSQWLWEVKHWVKQIKWNFEELARCSPEDEVLMAFPRNSESCCKFGCDHPEMCNLMNNPLRRMEEAPNGYEVDWWDPRKRLEEAEAVVDLTESKEIKKQETKSETTEHGSNE